MSEYEYAEDPQILQHQERVMVSEVNRKKRETTGPVREKTGPVMGLSANALVVLKKRYLKRHERDVAKFFECVSTRSVQSAVAKRLQERFMRG